MEAYLKAGVFFYDTVVRYTEVSETIQGAVELKRLGSCRFDFKVIDALASGNPELIETLREALTEVFEGSTPVEVCAALDPAVCITFQTAIPSDASDEAMQSQVLAEMALIADSDVPLHVSSDEIGTASDPSGSSTSHLQVLAFPDVIRENLDNVLSGISGEKHYFSSVQGAGQLLQKLTRQDDSHTATDTTEGVSESSADENSSTDVGAGAGSSFRNLDGFDIAVGQYRDHFEFAVCRSGQLLHVQYVPCSPTTNGLYHGMRLLRLLGDDTARVNRVFLYGEQLSDEAVEECAAIVGRTTMLDPLSVVQAAGNPNASFDGRSYVQCVGVALAPPN